MATLAFTVQADYDKLIALRNEITQLENQLKNLGANTSSKAVEDLQSKLASAKTSFTQVANSAAVAGKQIQDGFKKKIYDASQAVFDFREKIIAQKAVVADVAHDVKTLSEEYRKLAKVSPISAQDKLADLNAAKKALEEERAILFGLTQEQSKAALSVSRLNAEYKALRSTADEGDDLLEQMKDKFSQVAATITAGLGIKSFLGQMIEVRSQFQAADTAIETMLGSKEKADDLMSKVREYAKISPLEFSDVTSATQMMLGFNIEAEKVPKFLSAIGDVSMGNSQKFNSLTLAFSQMSAAGKLMGQDFNQMINAGFNPLQVMSEKTGKSISELKEQMSKGAISAEMVQQAFIDATSEGGKFYQMSEKGAETIQGQMSMLQDSFDAMFNNLGTKTEGVVTKAISSATKLVENYETIGGVLASLIVTYGTYRTALLINLALEKAHAGTLLSTIKATKAARVAQLALNTAMNVNPYVLLATAVMGVVTATALFADKLDKAKGYQKEFANAMSEAEGQASIEQKKLAELTGELEATKKGTKEYKRIKDEIINQFGQYDANLSTEIEKVGITKTMYDELAESIRKAALARGFDKKMEELTSQQDSQYVDNLKKVRESLISDLGDKEGAKEYRNLLSQLNKNKGHTGTTKAWKKDIFGNLYEGYNDYVGGFSGSTMKALNKSPNARDAVWDIINDRDTFNKSVADAKQLFGINDNDLKKNGKKKVTTPSTTPTSNTDKTDSNNDAERLKKEALARAKAQADYVKTVKRQNAQAALEIEQADIENLDDGFEKRTRQIDFNFKKMEVENKKREDDMLSALADNMLSQYIDKNPNKSEEERTAYRTSLTDENNPDRLKRKDLNADQINQLEEYERVAKETHERAAKELYKDLFDQYKSYSDRRKEVEQKFAEDVAAINKSGRTDTEKDDAIAEAERQRKESIERINNEEVEATRQTSSLMVDLFKDASEQSTRQLDNVVKKTKELLEYIKNTKPSDMTSEKAVSFGFSLDELKALSGAPDKIKAITEQVEKLENVASKSNPFRQLSQTIKDLFSKDGKDKDDDTETKLKKLGKSAAETADFVGGIAGNLSKMFEEVGNQDMAEAFGAVEETMGAVSNIGKGFAEGGLIGGIAAAAGEAMNLVGKAFAASARHAAALKEVMREMTAQQHAYTLAILDSKLAAEELTTVFGADAWGKSKQAVEVAKESYDNLTKAIQGTKEQQEQVVKNAAQRLRDSNPGMYGKLLAKEWVKKNQGSIDTSAAGLRSIEVKTGHKKTGMFGWGKGKDLYSSILSIYPDLIDAEGRLNEKRAEAILQSQTLKDDGKERLQQILDFQKEADKAAEQLKSYFTDIFGTLGNDMSNALVDAFKNGTDAAQAFTKSVTSMLEKLGEQMIYSVTLAPIMEEAQKKMQEITKNDKLSDDEKFRQYTQVLSNISDDAIAQQKHFGELIEQYKQMGKAKGYDLWGDTNKEQQQASRGYSQDMSEDTGKEVSGRLTAVAESGERRNETLLTISTKLDVLTTSNIGIRDIANDTRDIIAQSYLELQAIRENTETVIKPIRQIADDISTFKTSGMKMK